MRLLFNNTTMALTYLQIKFSEQYDPNVEINGEYYKVFTNKYGFAHYIARYLNTMYPPLTNTYSKDLPDETFNTTKELTDSISIMNYFLCDNKGNRLENNLVGPDIDITQNSTFQQLYGNDICAIFNVNDPPLMTSYTQLIEKDPETDQPYITSPYLDPLVRKITALGYTERIKDIAKTDRIYKLATWKHEKEICEIDDLVMSYLLGRTITPNSSMEDIYYVQSLLMGSYLQEKDKGIWDSDSGNLTDIIMEYQRRKVNAYTSEPIFVTGYFDIFTEGAILKDRGEQTYGIHGL